MKTKLLTSAVALTLASTAVPVYAQMALEEIVVTSRKVSENIQDIPIAITAVTGEDITNKGITNLMDIARAVPGLKTSQHPSTQSSIMFNIRGQTASDNLLTIDQAVGVYLDGVYVARPRGLNSSFFDIERIEVLKGPQGTLYGRNTTGGAVSIVTKGADFDGIHGFIAGDVGNYDLREIRGAINVPLIDDKLAVRLAVLDQSRDGFGESAVTGQDLGHDRNRGLYRGSVLFTPTEEVTVNFKAEHFRSDENQTLWKPIWFDPFGATALQGAGELGVPFAGPASFADPAFLAALGQSHALLASQTWYNSGDLFTSHTTVPQRDENTITTLGLTFDVELSDTMFLKSITGYRELESWQDFDLEGTSITGLHVGAGINGIPIVFGEPGQLPGPFSPILPPEQEIEFFSQEFNVGGTAMDERLDWLVGAYYSEETGRDIQSSQPFPTLLPLPVIPLNDGYEVINDSWSVFTQLEYDFTETLSTTVGVRYTEEDKALTSRSGSFDVTNGLTYCSSGVTNPDGSVPVIAFDQSRAACSFSASETFEGTSWLVSLNWNVSDSMLAYARLAEGFRGGAFQLRAPDVAPAGPETVLDFEVGLKADFLDNTLRANLAAYQSDYTNKQESIILPRADGTLSTVIQNAADATIMGFEGEFIYYPMDNLKLQATVAYVEGEYDSFPTALPIQGGAPVDASGEDFGLPPWTYSLSAGYTLPLDNVGAVNFNLDWYWTDGADPSDRNINPGIPKEVTDKTVANPSGGTYTNGRADLGLLNGRIDLNIDSMALNIGLFVTNLTDEEYWYSGIPSNNTGVLAAQVGAPRMYGLTVKKSFGE